MLTSLHVASRSQVCTIRNTPDKPIHCVVWAKDLLFPRLFGRYSLAYVCQLPEPCCTDVTGVRLLGCPHL
jgi:hypothetical protein